jgi:hypothetical protein
LMRNGGRRCTDRLEEDSTRGEVHREGAAIALQCISVSSCSLQRRGVDSRPLGVIEEVVVCCGLLTETEERKKRGTNVGLA